LIRVRAGTRWVGLEDLHYLVTYLWQNPDEFFSIAETALWIKTDTLAIDIFQCRCWGNHGYAIGANGFQRDALHAFGQVIRRCKQTVGDTVGIKTQQWLRIGHQVVYDD